MSDAPVEPAWLVIDVPAGPPWWLRPWVLAAVAGAGLAMFGHQARAGAFPWLPDAVARVAADDEAMKFIAAGLVLVGWLGTAAWRRRRVGRAVLGEHGVVLTRPTFDGDATEQVSLRWTDVRGYRDRSLDHVALEAAVRGPLAIPTPCERDRTAVLAFLDARGLKRLDA